MQEKYGFVYIWYDRKHKRYYIGCHWGTTYDGYICSSTWMKNSYKRRPQDFKRKILKYTSSKEEMFIEEFRYLSMIKSEEIGKRYYNLTLRNDINKWQIDKQKRKTTSLKISEANKGRKFSEEHKQKLSIAKKGKESSRKNAILSEQTKC